MKFPRSLLPILSWPPAYTRTEAQSDLIAAAIVTIMLVPQTLAYAMLAGLPPQVGLDASILPLNACAVFGTSRALAVGPVAVVTLMTAAAVGQVAAPGSAEYLTAAITLAFLSGLVLVAMSVLRLGFLFWTRKNLKPLLLARGSRPRVADLIAKAGPVVAIVASILAVVGFGLVDRGVKIVGDIPAGLPPFALPS